MCSLYWIRCFMISFFFSSSNFVWRMCVSFVYCLQMWVFCFIGHNIMKYHVFWQQRPWEGFSLHLHYCFFGGNVNFQYWCFYIFPQILKILCFFKLKRKNNLSNLRDDQRTQTGNMCAKQNTEILQKIIKRTLVGSGIYI